MKPKEKAEVFKDWFIEGIHNAARYIIIVSSDYDGIAPVYVFPEQSIRAEIKRFANDPYHTVETVMDLIGSIDDQVNAAAAPSHRLVSKIMA